MLRLTVEDLGTVLRVKVEGRLVGAAVRELEQSWRSLIRRSTGIDLIVDLTDTEFVDLAGTYLLSLMYRSGVQLRANSLYMKAVVAEIAGEPRADRI
jgi:anti-anti-sigma regulatory factor